jgi:hypothetical protein
VDSLEAVEVEEETLMMEQLAQVQTAATAATV